MSTTGPASSRAELHSGCITSSQPTSVAETTARRGGKSAELNLMVARRRRVPSRSPGPPAASSGERLARFADGGKLGKIFLATDQ